MDSSGDTESMLDEQEDFEFQDETKTIISIFKTENESVLVPVNVIKICSNSSKSNHNIKTITFEEGSQLESLEPYAFASIENLEFISFKKCKQLRSFSNWSFYGINKLRSVVFPDSSSFTELYYGCFRRSGIETIIFPPYLETIHSVDSVNHAVFDCCYSLKTVHFPINSKITVLSQRIFWFCEKLNELTLPPSITTIEEGAFYGCSSLQHVYILAKSITLQKDALFTVKNQETHFYVQTPQIKLALTAEGVNWFNIELLSKCQTFRQFKHSVFLLFYVSALSF